MKKSSALVALLTMMLGLPTSKVAAADSSAVELSLPAIISDNMVLQSDSTARIWGWGPAGGKVRVEFRRSTYETEVGPDGEWTVALPPLQVGGPDEMKISSGGNVITIKNILVGDVWLGGGQSNMVMRVKQTANPKEEISSAKYPRIRIFSVQQAQDSRAPVRDVIGQWQECSPESISEFSAVTYFFGRELYHHLGIPIGLISSSVGGTPAESWISSDGLARDKEFTPILKYVEESNRDFEMVSRKYLAEVAACLRANGIDWPPTSETSSDSGFDSWITVDVPDYWENIFFDIDGIGTYRKTVEVPETWVGHELELSLGGIADCDLVYVNGTKIGETGPEIIEHWKIPRRYKVPRNLVKRETYVEVRTLNYGGKGGFQGPEEDMFLRNPALPKNNKISLAGKWLFKMDQTFAPMKPPGLPERPINVNDPNFPTTLYNAMISPLTKFSIKGIIWYQGESNTDRAAQYQRLFPALIESWREAWNIKNLPFYYVQLAGFYRHMPGKPLPREKVPTKPLEDQWAELREAQVSTLSHPHTGMAVAIDIGDPTDIHPMQKQPIGRRLALIALNKTYHRDEAFSGPLYKNMAIEENAIRLSFDYVGKGLESRGGKLNYFAIAGADRVFHWANATIENDTILVSSPDVSQPLAVRYAWYRYPEGANLFSKDGLPASPFRTDHWPVNGK